MARARTWQLGNELWQLPEEGALMGILNVTPDSFSDGGQHNELEAALAHARKLMEEGADIIDIGGESTRPGAAPVTPQEEQRRVLPVIHALHTLRQHYPTLRLSIDTRHPETARKALEAGVDIINDITGLTHPAMRELCAAQPCGIVIMHMKGSSLHKPQEPYSTDIITEVRHFFEQQVAAAEQAGISPARLCLDPGIGFSNKSTEQNLELIHNLSALRVRNLPLLMGLSRKRFLGDVCGDPLLAKTSAHPTVTMSLCAAANGADLHRVHDIAPLRAALRSTFRNTPLHQANLHSSPHS